MAGRFVDIELSGVDKLIARIEKLGNAGERIMNKSMVETAIEAVSEMQRNTPVITNRLRSSEHFELPTTTIYQYSDNNGNAFNGKLIANLQPISVAFGTNVTYAESVNSRRKFFEKGVQKAKETLPKRLSKNLEKEINARG